MTAIGEPHAWSCGLYFLGARGGYCAQGGGRTERHHVELRSEHKPGEVTEDICTVCHKRIHREFEPYLYRAELPSGEYVYVEAAGKLALANVLGKVTDGATDTEAIAALQATQWPEAMWVEGEPRYWRVARLRGNCGEEVEIQAGTLMKEVAISIEIYNTGAARFGEALYALEQMGDGWQLFGYETKAMFAQAIGYSTRTVNAYIAAERTLFMNTEIKPEQRDALRAASMELRVSARKALSTMNTGQVQEVIDRSRSGAPVKDVVAFAKTTANAIESRKQGYKHAEVTLVARAATFVLEVPYLDGENPVAKAQTQIQFRPYVNVIDWAEDEQQGWEEVES